jgi:hypothetical protein
MRYSEIIEGATATYSRQNNKLVRKYRCTTGARKGRVVAQPATCNAPINVKASQRLKVTKAKAPTSIKLKSKTTKSHQAASQRLAGVQRIKPRTGKRKTS